MIKTTINNPEPERRENAILAVALALAVVLSIGMILVVLIGHVRAEPVTTFRDDKGRVQGYATKRGNVTTYENAKGQQTGRAERRGDGTIQFYDAGGRVTGTMRRR